MDEGEETALETLEEEMSSATTTQQVSSRHSFTSLLLCALYSHHLPCVPLLTHIHRHYCFFTSPVRGGMVLPAPSYPWFFFFFFPHHTITQPPRNTQVLAKAQQLHQSSLDKYQERKRKRNERLQQQQERQRKVDGEMVRLNAALKRQESNNTEMFKLFSELQAVSSDHKLGLCTPELVVVGMQSDGKSTFVEALLGFTFNVVSSNIGTRRPLVIQMMNVFANTQPVCRFRSENSDQFESPTPVGRLSEEILKRTNAETGSDVNRVSSKPIILRVEYSKCANLTIYDTPGFRLGGDPKLCDDIRSMVYELISRPDRIIVCLEQSTVEWANSIVRPLVAQVDPSFRRTILVNTKFDNRVKELRSKDEAISYLRGEALPKDTRVFFLSLPVERNAKPEDLQDLIQMCHMRDYEHLVRIGVDDKSFTDNLGFFNVKTHLERALAARYHQSFMPTLERLEHMVAELGAQLQVLSKNVEERDPAKLRAQATLYVATLCAKVERLLAGSAVGDPEQHGQTLQDERRSCPSVVWETLDLGYPVENAHRRLYGAAQFHRLLNEFAFVAHSVEFPPTSVDEVASALGTHPSHNAPSFQSAACDLVQLKSKAVLLPILATAVRRAEMILTRLFDVAVSVVEKEDFALSVIGSCQPFMKALREAFGAFVSQQTQACWLLLKEDVESFTSVIDWHSLLQLHQVGSGGGGGANIGGSLETKARVTTLMSMTVPLATMPLTREMDESSHQGFVSTCAKLFAGIRTMFVVLVRNKMSSALLKPVWMNVSDAIASAFNSQSSESFDAAFSSGAQSLQQQQRMLTAKLKQATTMRDSFREAGRRMRVMSTGEQ